MTDKKRHWKRYLLRHGALSLAFYAAVCMGLWAAQERLIFPGAYTEPFPGYDMTGMEEVLRPAAIPVEGGELFAIHAVPAGEKPIAILFHGNGSYPEDYADLHAALLRRGVGIVAPALRGYPRSTGIPGETAMRADALAVYDWARREHPRSLIVLVGHSLGSGLAVRLASEREVARVALLSPYLCMRSLVWGRLPFIPVDLLLRSPFRSDLAIAGVTAPVLAFHGEADRLIPVASGRALMELAPAGSRFVPVPGAGHNDGMLSERIVEEIGDFALGG